MKQSRVQGLFDETFYQMIIGIITFNNLSDEG